MMGFPYDFEPEVMAMVESVASVVRYVHNSSSLASKILVAAGSCNCCLLIYMAAYKQASE